METCGYVVESDEGWERRQEKGVEGGQPGEGMAGDGWPNVLFTGVINITIFGNMRSAEGTLGDVPPSRRRACTAPSKHKRAFPAPSVLSVKVS